MKNRNFLWAFIVVFLMVGCSSSNEKSLTGTNSFINVGRGNEGNSSQSETAESTSSVETGSFSSFRIQKTFESNWG